MSHLGILMACDHYPAVHPSRIDSQLRGYLGACGVAADRFTAFKAHDGELPDRHDACDAWIVSGAPLFGGLDAARHRAALLDHIRRASALGQPVFGVYHGEHVLHAALCASEAPAPQSPPRPWTIRNPFWSFWQNDRLYAYHPAFGEVRPIPRSGSLASAAAPAIPARAA